MKRGVALLWSLILIIILLITSSVMVTYIVKESQSTVRIEESTRAYAAAKSGVEWAKDQIAKNHNVGNTSKLLTIEQAEGGRQKVEADIAISRDGAKLTILATGIVGNVRRAIEQTITDAGYRELLISSPLDRQQLVTKDDNLPVILNDSFAWHLDFWLENQQTWNVPWEVGISSTAGSTILPGDSYVYFINKGNQLVLRVKEPNQSPVDKAIRVELTEVTGREKTTRLEVKYIEGIAASVQLSSHFKDEGKCVVVENIDLRDMGSLRYWHAPSFAYDSANKTLIHSTGSVSFQNLFVK